MSEEKFSAELKFKVKDRPYGVKAMICQPEGNTTRLGIAVIDEDGFSLSVNLPFTVEGVQKATDRFCRKTLIHSAEKARDKLNVFLAKQVVQ